MSEPMSDQRELEGHLEAGLREELWSIEQVWSGHSMRYSGTIRGRKVAAKTHERWHKPDAYVFHCRADLLAAMIAQCMQEDGED